MPEVIEAIVAPAVSRPPDPGLPVPDDRPQEPRDGAVIEADLLVEDVSIDGMCGVY
jgi:mycofactocin precursor